MIKEYIHTPPPEQSYFIVYPADKSIIHHGELTNDSNHLAYNYSDEEIFADKALWIARLLEFGIEYTEEEEL